MPKKDTRAALLVTGETKANCRFRLMVEGVWKEAIAYRQKLVKADVGHVKAWNEMAKKWPPGPDSPSLSPANKSRPCVQPPRYTTVDDAEGWRGDVPPVEVIEWVFENLPRKIIGSKDAPSSGAWGLLQACRRDPKLAWQFYTALWAKMLVKPDKEDDNKKSRGSDKPLQDLIKSIQKGNAAVEERDV